MCNRLAVSGYDNCLPMIDRSEEFGQAVLGLRSLDLTDVVPTRCVNRADLPIVPCTGQQRIWERRLCAKERLSVTPSRL